jgi:transcriptional regulator with XRE-family HTH domain
MLNKYIILDKQMGLEIKNIRIRCGFTLEQVAGKAGISVENLKRIEKGSGRIAFDTLCRISKILNVNPVRLLLLI